MKTVHMALLALGIMLIIAVGVVLVIKQTAKQSAATLVPDRCEGPLSGCVGKQVSLIGTVSTEMAQHFFVNTLGFDHINYLDPDSKQIDQTVFYTRTPFDAPAGSRVDIRGTVVEARYTPQEGSKLDTPSIEYQILVDSWSYAK